MVALAVTALSDDPKTLATPTHADVPLLGRRDRRGEDSVRRRSRQCMGSIQRSADSIAHAPGFRGGL